MREYTQEFLDHKRNLGSTPKAIYTMQWTLDRFHRFFVNEPDRDFNRQDLKRYHNYLLHVHRTPEGKPLSPVTVGNTLQRVKTYFSYLTQTGRYLINPASVLYCPEKHKSPPRDVPTEEAIKKLLDSLPDKTAQSMKVRAIFELLYSTGIRANELLGLDTQDVDLKSSKLTIREGKGKKDRYVPLGAKAKSALEKYLLHSRPFNRYSQMSPALFLGTRIPRFTYSGLGKLISKYGLKHGVSAHKLRHACAVGMIRNGADIRYIQHLLGHSNLNSTQIYTRLFPTDLKKAQSRYHPREGATPPP